MNVDDLCRKLRPVLGERVDEMWRRYQADPSSRQEIEGILRLLAARHLGADFRQLAVAFESPPADALVGNYVLGNVAYGGRAVQPFALAEEDWTQHVAIFGRTGSGKTNVGLLVLDQLLAHGKPFLVADWKRSYRGLNSVRDDTVELFTVGRNVRPFYFNPLTPPPGVSSEVWLKKVIEIMAHVYFLGEGVIYLLTRVLRDLYQQGGDVTFARLLEALEARKPSGREKGWMESALRAVASLTFGSIGDVVNSDRATPMTELLRKSVILELDALTEGEKTLVVETMLLWIHQYRLQQAERGRFLHALILEEAHHIVLRRASGAKENIADIILREIRELGEAVILLDQHPSLVSLPALGNTNCTIVLNLKHGSDLSAIGAALGLPDEERAMLGRLPIGQAVVRVQSRWHRPFLVEFPLANLATTSVSDAELVQIAGRSGRSAEVQPAEPAQGEIRPVQASEQIRGDELELLKDVMEQRTSSVRERYHRLGLSGERGTRALRRLVESGLLRADSVSTGKGRINFMRLTSRGVDSLRGAGVEMPDGFALVRNESAEHEYWKLRTAETLRAVGYEVKLEVPLSDGGATDVVAEKEGRRIAIEIETGSSDIVGNMEKNLAAGFDEVWVVATNKAALETCRGVVTGFGLVEGGKVEVKLASQVVD